jgi:hypothetical protein
MEYTILTGESYTVTADSEDEALAKMYAYLDGEPCPCGDPDCPSCVDYCETRTEII